MRIAYINEGQGDQVVVLPFHHNHVELRFAGLLWVRGLIADYRILHYDSRGQGLSTCDLDRDPTVDDYRRDLEAAIAAAGFERFVMVAYGGFAHVAIRYVLDNPERVRALVMICTSETHSAWPQAFFLSLAEENWELFLELELRASYYGEKQKRQMISFSRDCATQADYVRMVRCFATSSVAGLLPRLTLPTLVVHAKGQHWLSPQEGASLASKIPGARIVFLDGEIEPNDVEGVREILGFLKGLPAPAAGGAGGQETAYSARALSARQDQVLQLVAQGRTTCEIAEALVISERTVQRHIADIYDRIGVRNRSEATAYALGRTSTELAAPMGISTQ